MKKSYIKLLFLIFILIMIFIMNSIDFKMINQVMLDIILILLLFISYRLFGFEKDGHRYAKEIALELIISLITFFLLYYLSGILIGFAKTGNCLKLTYIIKIILPLIIFIILKEFLRYQLLTKSSESKYLIILVTVLFIFMDNTIALSSHKLIFNREMFLVISNISGDIQIHYKMPICQRATFLHTEECLGAYCSRMGYKVDGSYGTTTITYGSLGTTGSLASGDAFDCDVNGDGVYDSETERFYYVTDMENNSNIAILIYYNNVSEGKPSNEKYYQYDSSGENWHGPRTAIEQLPTTSQWSNVSLSNTERKLVNEYGTTSTKDGHTYPEVFSYSKYAARFLTLSEVKKIVNFYIPSWKNGELDNHMYLVENTNFSKKDNSKFDGYWLETPRNTMSNHGWMIYATARRVHSVEVQRTDVLIGVRPVIEVSKNDISY